MNQEYFSAESDGVNFPLLCKFTDSLVTVSCILLVGVSIIILIGDPDPCKGVTSFGKRLTNVDSLKICFFVVFLIALVSACLSIYRCAYDGHVDFMTLGEIKDN